MGVRGGDVDFTGGEVGLSLDSFRDRLDHFVGKSEMVDAAESDLFLSVVDEQGNGKKGVMYPLHPRSLPLQVSGRGSSDRRGDVGLPNAHVEGCGSEGGKNRHGPEQSRSHGLRWYQSFLEVSKHSFDGDPPHAGHRRAAPLSMARGARHPLDESGAFGVNWLPPVDLINSREEDDHLFSVSAGDVACGRVDGDDRIGALNEPGPLTPGQPAARVVDPQAHLRSCAKFFIR